MSYCRMGNDSDVYVYGDGTYLNCCACVSNFRTTSIQDMINHLKEHKVRGDKVPKYAIERLEEEKDRLGDKY